MRVGFADMPLAARGGNWRGVDSGEASRPLPGSGATFMTYTDRPRLVGALLLALVLTAAVALLRSVPSRQANPDGEWRAVAGDLHSSRYSALAQIDRDNVGKLALAWSLDVGAIDFTGGARPGRSFRATPLMANDTLYVSTALNRVLAIDPGTGELRWLYDPRAYERPRPFGGLSSRGVAYWRDPDDPGDERIVIATGGLQLIALDAGTGRPVPDFGAGGVVDLSLGLGRSIERRHYNITSPPTICRNTVVVGSQVDDNPRTRHMPPGHVRGYDVRTGAMKWVFRTIPQAGEFGNDTWEDEAWTYSGNTNVWSMMSCDEQLGHVYLPVGTATNDWYGGHRLGDNLFSDSLVCLDADSGERVWHFQGVHHGVWDYDFASAPNLVEITVEGRRVAAVAQVSKQGFTYVFDRASGEPVWPIEERPVPSSTVPGERLSRTQPFPSKPPPFERQGITGGDLIDFTPELHREALAITSDYVIGPLFTPPIVGGAHGKIGTIQVPGLLGGGNWQGAAFDPDTGFLYVPSSTYPSVTALRRGGESEDLDYLFSIWTREPPGPRGLPLLKPPYSRITAIDLNKGEIAWQIPHGEGPRSRVNAILGDGRDVGQLGTVTHAAVNANGLLVTETLLFANEYVRPMGIMRAFDKETGETIWENRIDARPAGSPITYLYEGRQYIAFAVGGGRHRQELRAYALR
jgi:quinoprotein glucose dehydrogenase